MKFAKTENKFFFVVKDEERGRKEKILIIDSFEKCLLNNNFDIGINDKSKDVEKTLKLKCLTRKYKKKHVILLEL